MTFADYLQTQPLLRVAAALMLGIVVGDKLWWALPLWAWLIGIAVCLLINLFLKNSPCAKSLFIFCAVFFTGVVLIAKADYDSLDPFRNDVPLSYEAVITNEPQAKGKVLKCDLNVLSVNGETLQSPVAVKAMILRDTVNNNWKRLQLGSGIRAQSFMQPLTNYRKNSNFDYVRWLCCHGFRAQTFIYYSDWRQERISLASLSRLERLRLLALKFRQKLVRKLKNNNEYDNEDQQSAVVAAMVLGDKQALSKETKDAFSVSGASHILALSGLHLGIIYTVLTLLFGSGYRRRWLSQAFIIIAIWTYVVLVGMGTSVMRSALMLTIYSLCLVAGRDKASVNALSLAAIVILVANPLSLWDVGFQMSFMAVFTIVIFYNKVYSLLPHNGNITRFSLINWFVRLIWGMAVVSFTAQIGTAPLIAYYFGRFSCYFLFANYVVVPCATIIIYGALAVFISSPIPLISNFLVKVLNLVSSFLNWSVNGLASLPGASFDNIHINIVHIFCYYTLVAIVCIAYSYLKKMKSLKAFDAFKKNG